MFTEGAVAVAPGFALPAVPPAEASTGLAESTPVYRTATADAATLAGEPLPHDAAVTKLNVYVSAPAALRTLLNVACVTEVAPDPCVVCTTCVHELSGAHTVPPFRPSAVTDTSKKSFANAVVGRLIVIDVRFSFSATVWATQLSLVLLVAVAVPVVPTVACAASFIPVAVELLAIVNGSALPPVNDVLPVPNRRTIRSFVCVVLTAGAVSNVPLLSTALVVAVLVWVLPAVRVT